MRERFYNLLSVPTRTHRASAPTRIDLAGGTIDIWPLYLFHDGAATLNAAISLRAQVTVDPRSEGIELRSIDADRAVHAPAWSDLDPAGPLPLLVRAARHYRIERVSVTTRAESPAGAGIAGSSALTIALCGAFARLTGASINPGDLLQIAMNIECQTIQVPTGVQDYRPATYGGIAAIELAVDGVRPSRARTAHRPGVHRRAAAIGHEQLGDCQTAHRRRPRHLRLFRTNP
jgi:D-glycero-alpha-D-manno-heptose-7-phosphate kinase